MWQQRSAIPHLTELLQSLLCITTFAFFKLVKLWAVAVLQRRLNSLPQNALKI